MMSATAIETVRTMQTAIVTATTTATATRSGFVFVTATGSVFGTETETETAKRIGTARHFGFPRLTATSNWTPSNSGDAPQPCRPTDGRTAARNRMSQAVAGRLNAEACWSIPTPTNTGRVDESRECAIRSTVNFSTVAEKEFVSSSLSSRAHDKQQANDRCHNPGRQRGKVAQQREARGTSRLPWRSPVCPAQVLSFCLGLGRFTVLSSLRVARPCAAL
jgi:hypothetical protein